MSELLVRALTLSDVPALERLIDAQESHFDPRHKPVGSAWPTNLVSGAFAEVLCLGVFEESELVASVCLDFDQNRKKVLAELFRLPGYEAVLAMLWNTTRDEHRPKLDGWLWWPTVNQLDLPLQELLHASDGEPSRYYYSMSAQLAGRAYPTAPEGVDVRLVRAPDDYADWHLCHQESFKSHHGFKPRPMADWIDIVVNHDGYDPDGTFIAYVDGEPAGFVTCDNRSKHLNTGYINMLGVREKFQSRGLGELLLRWGLAYCAELGFETADLAVDTDNVTSALHLYEKVGFESYSGFILFEAP